MPRTRTATSPPSDRPVPVPPAIRRCLHALLVGLLALAAVKAVTGGAEHRAGVVAAAVVMGAVYTAGTLHPAVGRSRRAAGWWLTALAACWLMLLVLSPDGLWAAFPLYFLQLHLLPKRRALPAVLATAAAAIASFLVHSARVTPGSFIGPLLGAAVAVATVLGYEALYRESERRRELIDELMATRAELAAAERTAGTLAERERLAREIHDTLAQGLSSIQLLLRAAQRALPAGSPAGPHIERAREAAQDNLAEARRFVRALSPPDLEHGSLAGALERLCASSAGPRVRFSLSGTPAELPTPYEVALLRVAQSALANTVRHAEARRAEITLTFMDASVTLDVVDDGRGFEPAADGRAAGERDGGFGLPAMRARAQSLGGTFTVESAPGQGTAVAISLPLPARTKEDAA
ncbi:sensor histidine kinase [Streptomyces alfalfae]|uniref:Oxygen sensor histidine kinase NreB n=1 Tax=Streptomyces alfalfae TaxID=1642299 RepID=A0ABM6GQA1_9ACTN|nr:sensor histidine kinase [Streptomyces alfalfae]APY85606.1 two-component sensor histidine kinase [Streptomyces alfalfae]AYA15961.1 sensor histidine kinase [Streptomyces fradiae]RXX39434.1 sensor histidine kinase [Streptomyces alfalfae]RZM83729.1 sensor histidine kinase [Streptomyces alfalfae]